MGPMYTYAKPGRVTVRLRVTVNHGASSTAGVSIQLQRASKHSCPTGREREGPFQAIWARLDPDHPRPLRHPIQITLGRYVSEGNNTHHPVAEVKLSPECPSPLVGRSKRSRGSKCKFRCRRTFCGTPGKVGRLVRARPGMEAAEVLRPSRLPRGLSEALGRGNPLRHREWRCCDGMTCLPGREEELDPKSTDGPKSAQRLLPEVGEL